QQSLGLLFVGSGGVLCPCVGRAPTRFCLDGIARPCHDLPLPCVPPLCDRLAVKHPSAARPERLAGTWYPAIRRQLDPIACRETISARQIGGAKLVSVARPWHVIVEAPRPCQLLADGACMCKAR